MSKKKHPFLKCENWMVLILAKKFFSFACVDLVMPPGIEPGIFAVKGRCLNQFDYGTTWRREWDSNPRPVAGSLDFKASSLNHSDTSPYNQGRANCNLRACIMLPERSSRVNSSHG